MKLRNAFLVAGALLAGCGDNAGQVTGNTDDSASAVKEIIGGFDAKAASLNAVGTIGLIDEATGQYSFFCTGTLIAPQTVITAKSCAIVTNTSSAFFGMKLVNLEKIFFAVGPDANAPVKVVEAIAADLSPVNEGGFVYLGNDVAVLHLISPVEGVKPIAVADLPLTDKDVDQAYVALGFGTKDVYEDLSGVFSATRSAGKNTLRALQGKTFELMLGSWDAFIAQMVEIYGQDIVDAYMDIFEGWYAEELLSGYEAYVGNKPGDVQTCNGDAGGPLVGREMGEKKIFGIASAQWFSKQKTCDYGSFYATFGTETYKMLETASKYEDPCAGGITAVGSCDGEVATRCTDKFEGDRRLSQMDCSLLDQVCAIGNDGKAGCFDEGDLGGAQIPSAAKAPTIAELRKDVQNLSKPQRRWAISKE